MKISAEVQTSHLRHRFPLIYFFSRPLNLLERESFESLLIFKSVLSRTMDSVDSKDQALKTIHAIEALFGESLRQVPLFEQTKTYAIVEAHPDLALAWEAWCSLEETYDLPRTLALEFIDGLKWDIENRDMSTLEDLLRYAYLTGGLFGYIAARILNLDPAAHQNAVDAASSARFSSLAQCLERDLSLGRRRTPKDLFPRETSKAETSRFLNSASEILFQSFFESMTHPNLSPTVSLKLKLLSISALVLHREQKKQWLAKLDIWFDVILRWSARSIRLKMKPLAETPSAISSLANSTRHQKFVLSKSFKLTSKRSSGHTPDTPNMSH